MALLKELWKCRVNYKEPPTLWRENTVAVKRIQNEQDIAAIKEIESELWDQRLNDNANTVFDSPSITTTVPNVKKYHATNAKMQEFRLQEKSNKWFEPDMSEVVHEKALFMAGLRDSWTDKSGKERTCE